MLLTYRYRVKPTRAQHAALEALSEEQRHLYNAALEERISAWQKAGLSITRFDQYKSLTLIRAHDPVVRATAVAIQRATLQRIDVSMKGFFSRVKRGKTAGFPRFKSASRWSGFGFAFAPSFDGRRLRFRGMPGGLRVNLHRPLPGRIKTAFMKRDARGWVVGFIVEVTAAEYHEGDAVGIDLGIEALMTFSHGERIANPRSGRAKAKKLQRAQRALARCRRGSARRRKVKARLARVHQHIADTRSTYLHQVSCDAARRFSLLVVEDLNVKGLARGWLAREVHDAAWSRLVFQLTYKAERAGGRVVLVDPRYTSQTCSGCGMVVKKALAARRHVCACGTDLHRDHNAALVILLKGMSAAHPAGGSAPVARQRSGLPHTSCREYQLSN